MTRTRLRGLLLAALVVLSTLAAAVSLAGTAAAASPTSAVEYDDGTIEVVLDEPATVSPADVEVVVGSTTRSVESVDGNGTRTITLDAGADVAPVEDATVRFDGDVTGAVAVVATGATADLSDGTVEPDPVFVGTPVAVVAGSVDTVFDTFENGTRVTTRGTGVHSRVFVFDSSDVAPGTTLEFDAEDGGSATVPFAALDLRVSAPSTVRVGAAFTVTATTDVGVRDVQFVLVDDRGTTVDATTAGPGTDGGPSATLTVPDAAGVGNYTVLAVDADSGVSATSDTVAAMEPGTATPTASESNETRRGGAAIPGLGGGVAAVALVGAATLTRRR